MQRILQRPELHRFFIDLYMDGHRFFGDVRNPEVIPEPVYDVIYQIAFGLKRNLALGAYGFI